MSFDYGSLNLEVIDGLRLIYAKPAHSWTPRESAKVAMGLEAMRIVAGYAPKPEFNTMGNRPKEST